MYTSHSLSELTKLVGSEVFLEYTHLHLRKKTYTDCSSCFVLVGVSVEECEEHIVTSVFSRRKVIHVTNNVPHEIFYGKDSDRNNVNNRGFHI